MNQVTEKYEIERRAHTDLLSSPVVDDIDFSFQLQVVLHAAEHSSNMAAASFRMPTQIKVPSRCELPPVQCLYRELSKILLETRTRLFSKSRIRSRRLSRQYT